MPLKLIPPRPGKSPNYSIRGTYQRIYIDRTTGTSNKQKAQDVLKGVIRQIESGEFRKTEPAVEEKRSITFAEAALAYLKAGGDPKYISALTELTGEHALRDKSIDAIDQIAIDNAVSAIYPDAPATTRNRQGYTPISAILKRAGVERKIMRPIGWRETNAACAAS